MGCFDSKNSGSGTQPISKARDPEEKPYEWFLSDVGHEVYKEFMVQENFDKDKEYEKEQKEKDCEYFSVYVHVYRKGHKSPRIFFESLVTALGKTPGCSDALEYTFPIDTTASKLGLLAEPYLKDDNGDLMERPQHFTPEQLVDYNVNPLLKFVHDFNAYGFEDGDWKAKIGLWNEAAWFILYQIIEDKLDVLEKNPWLFEKETYLNATGGMRTKKGFFNTGIEKSNNPDYFKEHLAELEEDE